MGNEVAKTEAADVSVGAMWAGLVDLVKDPSVDASKLQALVSVQGDMMDRAAKDRFDRAFALAVGQMPIITKDDRIEHVKNAGTPQETRQFIGWFKKYEDLRSVVDDIANPLGLYITHDSSEIDGGKGGILVWTIITYVDSEYTWTEVRGRVPVPPDGGGAKGAAQAIGSAITYGQRYSLVAAFGIVQKGLDRDGQSLEAQRLMLEHSGGLDSLVATGETNAKGGKADFLAWFKAQSNMTKGQLVSAGEYDRLLAIALKAGK